MSYQTVHYRKASSKGEKLRLISGPMRVSWKAFGFSISLSKWRSVASCITLIGALVGSGCTSEYGGEHDKQNQAEKGNAASKSVHKEVGEASWYGPGFKGNETANGETFDPKELTAAHPSLPMGTKAKVTNLENDKKVDVRINDRGPYADNRVIDLSRAAAKKLDMEGEGTTRVKIETKSTKKKASTK